MLVGQGCPRFIVRFFVCVLLFGVSTVKSAEFRIVGGVQATPEQAPYLAALLQQNRLLKIAGATVPVQVFSDSLDQSFEAPLSHCGYGLAPCADAEGKVCVIARGTNTFAEKVANCAASGGVSVLVTNYFDRTFLGAVGHEQPLPVFALPSSAREYLLSHMGEVATYDFDENHEGADFFCGGSYLGDGWVVTAAHCVYDRAPEDLLVTFGTGDYRDGRVFYTVDAVRAHVEFSNTGFSLAKDVALLSLVDLPDDVKAIALADWDDQREAIGKADAAQVYGRGEGSVVVEGGAAGLSQLSGVAEFTALPIVDHATCANAMPNEPLEGDMLCAGNLPATGTCFGDSGGPLVWQSDGEEKLLGIVSWGVGCGLEGYYDVFASVASYHDNLQDVVGGRSEELNGVTEPGIVLRDEETIGLDSSKINGGGGAMGFAWVLLVIKLLRQRRLLHESRVV